MSLPEKIVPLVLNRKAKQRMKVNHLIPGATLLILGVEALGGGGDAHVYSAWLNIVVGGAVIVAVVRELRKRAPREHSVIGWVDAFAGCVIIVEGINHYHPHKGFQPAYLYWLAGLLTILLGVFHEKVSSVRRITFRKEALSIRTRLLRSFTISWDAIASIQFSRDALVLQTQDGGTLRLGLKNYENIEQIRDAFSAEAASHEIDFVDKGNDDRQLATRAIRGKP